MALLGKEARKIMNRSWKMISRGWERDREKNQGDPTTWWDRVTGKWILFLRGSVSRSWRKRSKDRSNQEAGRRVKGACF